MPTTFNDGNQWHQLHDVKAYNSWAYEWRCASGLRMDSDHTRTRDLLAHPSSMKFKLMYQYPYAEQGSPESHVDYLWDLLGPLRDEEFLMLDIESKSGIADPTNFWKRWRERVVRRFNTNPWVYVERAQSAALTPEVTAPGVRKCPRYSGNATRGAAPTWSWDVHQYTDRGPFPGSPHGPGDCNYTAMSVDELIARSRGITSNPIAPARPALAFHLANE